MIEADAPESPPPERSAALLKAARTLIETDECGAVILGAGADAVLAPQLRSDLFSCGLPATVIAPVPVGVFAAAAALWADTAHSKISYPFPDEPSHGADIFMKVSREQEKRQERERARQRAVMTSDGA